MAGLGVLVIPVLIYTFVFYVVMPAALPVKVTWQIHPILQASLRTHVPALYLHILPSMIALGVGLLQFRQGTRQGRRPRHRMMGRVYAVSVLVGGLAGLYLSVFSFAGMGARLGFGTLAVAWLVTTGLAVKAIRRRDIDTHRDWMIRSYALTLAGLMLRIYNLLWFGAGYELPEFHPLNAWLCWVPNIIIAEAWIRLRNHSQGASAVPLQSEPIVGVK
jgi:uncharacterized membrane protein YozB (DUF420 family)